MARRCFVPPGIRFCLAVQRALALSRSTMVDYYRHSVAAPSWPHADSDEPGCEGAEARLATLLEQQPHGPYYLLVISLAVRWHRVLRRGCVPVANRWHFFTLLDTWPPETPEDSQKKKLMVWTRKCWRRLTASARPAWRHGECLRNGVAAAIEGNYADAVRLLTTAQDNRTTVKRRCLLLNARFREV